MSQKLSQRMIAFHGRWGRKHLEKERKEALLAQSQSKLIMICEDTAELHSGIALQAGGESCVDLARAEFWGWWGWVWEMHFKDAFRWLFLHFGYVLMVLLSACFSLYCHSWPVSAHPLAFHCVLKLFLKERYRTLALSCRNTLSSWQLGRYVGVFWGQRCLWVEGLMASQDLLTHVMQMQGAHSCRVTGCERVADCWCYENSAK